VNKVAFPGTPSAGTNEEACANSPSATVHPKAAAAAVEGSGLVCTVASAVVITTSESRAPAAAEEISASAVEDEPIKTPSALPLKPVRVPGEVELGIPKAATSPKARKPLLINEQLKKGIEQLDDQASSPVERAFGTLALAEGFKLSVGTVEKLHSTVERQRYEAADGLTLLKELERLAPPALSSVRALIPPQLAKRFDTIQATARFHDEVLLSVLFTGLMAALPLKSRIVLDPVQDFSQPMTLWLLLLMASGESKSPMISRLVTQPWKASVEPLLAKAYQEELDNWKVRKAQGDATFSEPKPRKPPTLVSDDYTTEGLDAAFMTHDRWANRSVLLEVDEAASLLNRLRTSTDSDLSWMLSRYDGKGARNARADQERERSYNSCRLGIIAACQPDVYEAISGDGDASGWTARLLVVKQLQVEQAFPCEYSMEMKLAAEELTKWLIAAYRVMASCKDLTLTLSNSAFRLFQEERKDMQNKKNNSLNEAERSLANKAAGRIGRLAAGFHLLRRVEHAATQPVRLQTNEEIETSDMEKAITFHRLLHEQTLAVRLAAGEVGSASSLALKIHRKIWHLEGKAASFAELRKMQSSGKRSSQTELLAALKPLVEAGYGRLDQVDSNGSVGCRYYSLKALPSEV